MFRSSKERLAIREHFFCERRLMDFVVCAGLSGWHPVCKDNTKGSRRSTVATLKEFGKMLLL
jgi:hypothetical protein